MDTDSSTPQTGAPGNAAAPRTCYYIDLGEYDEGKGFVPCLVTEGQPGFSVFRGNGEFAVPWYWGKTYDEAQELCARMNLEDFGLTKAEAAGIVRSSMAVTPGSLFFRGHDHG
jgi:hypothetical protein